MSRYEAGAGVFKETLLIVDSESSAVVAVSAPLLAVVIVTGVVRGH